MFARSSRERLGWGDGRGVEGENLDGENAK
jgi:hypothetical protein